MELYRKLAGAPIVGQDLMHETDRTQGLCMMLC